ncbi:hypothetical protein I4F81_007059 [Pyropia yezoensis]|uniref:Uncharacterized protein n=1 Tax=Pyropia yezoensis TaxID=2788 RepID=A0ACC3C3Z4_PYRYE|nr:hypothetical protein I4F81_007059 [Neopyropia yezoensis]
MVPTLRAVPTCTTVPRAILCRMLGCATSSHFPPHPFPPPPSPFVATTLTSLLASPYTEHHSHHPPVCSAVLLMKGGITKASPAGVRRTSEAGAPGAAARLRATELGAAAQKPSSRRTGGKGPTRRRQNAGEKSRPAGSATHFPPAVHPDEVTADGCEGGQGTDLDGGSNDGDSGNSSGSGESSGLACGNQGHSCGGGSDVDEGSEGGEDGGEACRGAARVAGQEVGAATMPRARYRSAASRARSTVTYTTGDDALRAGLVHAVQALGRYSLMGTPRKGVGAPAGPARGPTRACPEVFVVR